jgi:Fe-S-cluster containining protein
MMDIQTKFDILAKLYDLYDETVSPFASACGRGCAACCTCNVTCTTLEGWFMLRPMLANGKPADIESKVSAAPPNRFQPALTINRMVALCVNGDALPPEMNDPGAGPCLWLKEHQCPIYSVRPFACRAMQSTEPCSPGGEACMPDFVLSLNNVMMQYIEALDRPGATGNLIDILAFLSEKENREAYINQQGPRFVPPLAVNRSFCVLMIPPEHRHAIEPFLERIQSIFQQRS